MLSRVNRVVLQVLAGLAIVYVIYVLALLAMRADRLAMDKKFDVNAKNKVVVIDGYVDASSVQSRRYNTVQQDLANYLPITPSVNRRGGAQFSYSLWVYVGQPDACTNACIFLRGDPAKYTYGVTDHANNVTQAAVNDRVALCPALSFGAQPMEFTVTFNTLNNMHETLAVTRQPSDDNIKRKNMLSLFAAKWVCLTVVFEDNIPINDFENGTVVRFYVNDTLYQSGQYASALRQNQGDLVLFPDATALPQCKIANFAYYNYALTDSDISTIAATGPSSKPAALALPVTLPYYVSDYNKLDLYNT